ncbi:MazG nucleotide pyrophosphohydrolase domain-containing protein [Streptomyces rimosus]|uniref:MazG nucleotide pyrophosphohydrolase domain-containing protein n=1 Tax=Streptomyces rimosus TaxID=1927 RepID=UPI00051895A3|nr:MazG nucleotide pyrophosphohydrolase domain-containing protein [Streptomyces rimosus]
MTYEPMAMVREFHDAFGVDRETDVPSSQRPALVELRQRLIKEECREAAVELTRLSRRIQWPRSGRSARIALAKELADILYVVYGTADVLSIPLEEVFEEVHRSNMSKLGLDGHPVRRHDGKVLKGPGYREADVEAIVFRDEERRRAA